MKKALALLLLLALAATLPAQEPPALNVGVSGSVGLFDFGDNPDELLAIVVTLVSIRGVVDATWTVPLGGRWSAGVSAGVGALSLAVDTTSVAFLDVPLRAVVKFGTDNSFVEPFAGYYWNVLPFDEKFPVGAPEVGARVALGGLFAESSWVFGVATWHRLSVGWTSALATSP